MLGRQDLGEEGVPLILREGAKIGLVQKNWQVRFTREEVDEIGRIGDDKNGQREIDDKKQTIRNGR
jgi:hypothetical protein